MVRMDYTGEFKFPSWKGQIKVLNQDYRPNIKEVVVRVLLSHSITLVDSDGWSTEETKDPDFPFELRITGRSVPVGDWWFVRYVRRQTRWPLRGEVDVLYGAAAPIKATLEFEGPPK